MFLIISINSFTYTVCDTICNAGVACLENGVVIRGTDNPENRRGGRSGRGRGNHNAGRNNAMEDHNMGQLDPDPFDSSGTDDDVVLDAMEIDDHVGNPNDF